MKLETLATKRGLPVIVARSPEDLARRQAEDVAGALRRAIGQQGAARMALSGGRSPEAFLRCLNEQAVDWSRVAITLVDERWVPESDPESNAGMLWECLPRALSAARWLPLFRGETPARDAHAVELELASWLPLDIVVLGMGTDGHCASLFPGQEGLEPLLRADSGILCAATRAPDGSPRITLAAAALCTARLQLLVISGDDKYQRLCEAFCASPTMMPVAAFLSPPLRIFYSPSG